MMTVASSNSLDTDAYSVFNLILLLCLNTDGAVPDVVAIKN